MATERPLTKQAEECSAERTRGGQTFRPNVDIVETANELLLIADVPGVKSDEINLHFEDDELTVHGPVAMRQCPQEGYLFQEYGLGDFYRTFRVSEQIDATRIHADVAQGVLTVHLPKAEAARPRKIPVKFGA